MQDTGPHAGSPDGYDRYYYTIFRRKRESKMKKIRIFPLVLILCLAMSAAAPTAWALDDPSLNGKAAHTKLEQC